MLELDTPETVLDGYSPKNQGEYRQAFLSHLKRHKKPERPQSGTLRAGINCGRWIANCPCGSGVAVHPQWPIAGCFGCGRWWVHVEFPSEAFLLELEKALKQRPPGHGDVRSFWSWDPDETIEDIRRQNEERGWRPPQGEN